MVEVKLSNKTFYHALLYIVFKFGIYLDQQLVWYLNSAAVWVGEICLRDDGLLGPCMVGFGATIAYLDGLQL